LEIDRLIKELQAAIGAPAIHLLETDPECSIKSGPGKGAGLKEALGI
jgi:hypothetical protein